MARVGISLAWAIFAAVAGTLVISFAPVLFDAVLARLLPAQHVSRPHEFDFIRPMIFFGTIGFVSAYTRGRKVQVASGGPTS